jgi:hypothetical protein
MKHQECLQEMHRKNQTDQPRLPIEDILRPKMRLAFQITVSFYYY